MWSGCDIITLGVGFEWFHLGMETWSFKIIVLGTEFQSCRNLGLWGWFYFCQVSDSCSPLSGFCSPAPALSEWESPEPPAEAEGPGGNRWSQDEPNRWNPRQLYKLGWNTLTNFLMCEILSGYPCLCDSTLVLISVALPFLFFFSRFRSLRLLPNGGSQILHARGTGKASKR